MGEQTANDKIDMSTHAFMQSNFVVFLFSQNFQYLSIATATRERMDIVYSTYE